MINLRKICKHLNKKPKEGDLIPVLSWSMIYFIWLVVCSNVRFLCNFVAGFVFVSMIIMYRNYRYEANHVVKKYIALLLTIFICILAFPVILIFKI